MHLKYPEIAFRQQCMEKALDLSIKNPLQDGYGSIDAGRELNGAGPRTTSRLPGSAFKGSTFS
ncbi:MAG: hypothetical protein C4530_02630 [Desulfobacteraceae bacterium]|nr:MAG: hypothetical protein C4530_02630 [Desulfobacteraceae bacterium]